MLSFWDPLAVQPHDPEVRSRLRLAVAARGRGHVRPGLGGSPRDVASPPASGVTTLVGVATLEGMRILALSDVVEEGAYAPDAGTRFASVDLVLGCGDLPYDYLDYVATKLGAPLYAVHGNHDVPPESSDDPTIGAWWRGIDLHARVVAINGLLVGGLGGSPRYSRGPYQLSEGDMLLAMLRMLPSLIVNRLRRGRYLDVLVTHAPPRGIHDHDDVAHRGFRALRLFLRLFRPRVHLHGHTHVYDARTVTRTSFRGTDVVNAYGARSVELDAR